VEEVSLDLIEHDGGSPMTSALLAQPYAATPDLDLAPGGDLPLPPRPRPVAARSRTRVLIASAQPLVRHGLRALVSAEDDLDVIAEAEDGGSAVALARQLRPDVVLIELLMPQVDGITATRMIRAEMTETQVVVITGVDEDAPAIESIRAGASAYLPKEARTDLVLRTIRGASAGQVALPSYAISRLVRVVGRHEGLSERESEVLRLVARGKANKQIARELDIAQSTVKSHVGSILAKLGLESRTQLALYAARTGMVALESCESAQ
jgi:NarL family two-component system response regulator LiaR